MIAGSVIMNVIFAFGESWGVSTVLCLLINMYSVWKYFTMMVVLTIIFYFLHDYLVAHPLFQLPTNLIDWKR